MVNGMGYQVILGPLCQPNTSSFKGKNRKNAQENERPLGKTAKSREAGNARPCHPGRTAVPLSPWAMVNTTDSPWWLLPSPIPRLLECCVSVHFWSTGFALDDPYWAYWASFTNFFDLLSSQLHSFSYYLPRHK